MPRILVLIGVVVLVMMIGIYFQQKARIQDLKNILNERDGRIFELERQVAELQKKVEQLLRK